MQVDRTDVPIDMNDFPPPPMTTMTAPDVASFMSAPADLLLQIIISLLGYEYLPLI
jgi:hypothetical protein